LLSERLVRAWSSSLVGSACCLLVSGCLLSDFDRAERRERERTRHAEVVRSQSQGGAGGAEARVSAADGGGMLERAGRGGDAADAGASAHGDGRSGAAGATGREGGDRADAGPDHAGAGDAGAPATSGRGGTAAAGAGAGGDAGASGNAGASANGGAGGIAGAGGAGNSGAAGCGDLARDPAHCGSCDNDCSADMALASCEESKCVRACSSGYADCNEDLSFGRRGDGCETSVVSDPNHCGGCALRCDAAAGTVPLCDANSCMVLRASVGPGEVIGELHGGGSGGMGYEHLCSGDEALVGFDAAVRDGQLIGFSAVCAQQLLNGSAQQLTIVPGSERVLPALGNDLAMVEKTPASRMQCPGGSVVTAAAGVTAYFNTDVLNVKQLRLTCSQAEPRAAGGVELRAISELQLGAADGADAEFADECPDGQVVVGFAGRHGALIDSVQTYCAPFSVTVQPGMLVDSAP
jgi:hypothetical protein